MSGTPPHPRLTDALPSQMPGVHWPAVVGARDAAVLALLFQMERTQWLSGEALREQQNRQLGALLDHARRYCRFYRDRLPDNAARWYEIPLLTRADLQTQADAVRATAYPRAHGKIFDIATGGSTAEPVTVRRTALTQLFWQAATLRDHLWHRRDLSATMAIIRQFPEPVDETKPGRWGGVLRSGPAWHLPISTDVEAQLRWLQGVDPDILLIYPANLDALLTHMLHEGFTLERLREVRTISGAVTPALRKRCQTLLGTPLASGNESRQARRCVPRRWLTYKVGNARQTDALVADWLADHLGQMTLWPFQVTVGVPLNDAGVVADRTAVNQYRARYQELLTEKTEAEDEGDHERVEEILDELSQIAAAITGAVGRGGKPRKLGDKRQNVRDAFRIAVNRSITCIGRYDKVLAEHLDKFITRGGTAVYRPEIAVVWDVRPVTPDSHPAV